MSEDAEITEAGAAAGGVLFAVGMLTVFLMLVFAVGIALAAL